jgi:hypothetical protein
MREQVREDSNPDRRGWSSPCFRYTTDLRERTTRIERASPSWQPGALPLELRPHAASATRAIPGSRGRLFSCSVAADAGSAGVGRNGIRRPETRAKSSWRGEAAPDFDRLSLRQESNPHFGRTKGACLPLTLRRRDGDAGSRTRSSSVQARCSFHMSFIPEEVRTGGFEPPRPGATGLQPGEFANTQRPHEG